MRGTPPAAGGPLVLDGHGTGLGFGRGLLRPVRIVPGDEDGHEWLERCAVLRANPEAAVYVRLDADVYHHCRSPLDAELTFDDAGPVRPGLAFCVHCRRIGVLWEAPWLPPEDLRIRVDEAVIAFDAWLDGR